MSNLQKFEQTLLEFDSEVEQLKDISKAYKKLNKLTDTYTEILDSYKENNNTLVAIGELQKIHDQNVLASLLEINQVSRSSMSEIKTLIEAEKVKIRTVIEGEIRKSENALMAKIKSEASLQNQLIEEQLNAVKTTIWMIGIPCLLLLLIAVMKLW